MRFKFLILIACFIASCLLSSCNFTRVVSTEASSYQRGDTSVHVVTRTVETYDATKKH